MVKVLLTFAFAALVVITICVKIRFFRMDRNQVVLFEAEGLMKFFKRERAQDHRHDHPRS